MIAQVAFNIAVDKTFDYRVPPELEGRVGPGHMVQAPFKVGVQPGIILSISASTNIRDVKLLHNKLHPEPLLSEDQIALAKWLSTTYLAPIGLCIWFLLPAGMEMHHEVIYALQQDVETKSALESEILELARRRGSIREKQLDLNFAGKHWRAAVDALLQSGAVRRDYRLTPPRARPRIIQTAALAIPPDQIDATLSELQRPSRTADLLELLAADSEPLDEATARKRTNATAEHIRKLTEAGWIEPVHSKRIRLIRESGEVRDELQRLRKTATLAHVLRLLARERAAVDVSWIYAQTEAKLADLKKLEEAGAVTFGEHEVWRDPLAKHDFVPTAPPTLTEEQSRAWQQVEGALTGHQPATFLLHGVTGSGKTEIYLRAIARVLEQGRDAIFLVPEIALTAQTVQRVAARFPGQVAIFHSQLKEGERFDTWRRAHAGLFKIVVGARSALFTPFRDIGLIILDEEHDQSYQQSGGQSPPHYHARAAAEQIAVMHNAVVLLGSATPAIETMYRAEHGDIHYLRLPNRILGHRTRIHHQEQAVGVHTRYHPTPAPEAVAIDLPPVEVVDMRAELHAGHTSIFSRSLQRALERVLLDRQQALLLMNRRGQASYVFCRDCGYVALCPRCDTPLAHHREGETLRCHRCGHNQPAPTACPACSSPRIRYFGAGTQQVEQTVKTLFPEARVLRWDADSASTPGAHEAILKHFIDRYADVIVGTQMIAKGLDLPMVTLVGVISADISLNLPDFRAAERSFQLLTQMAGRAGRGLLGGKVILQTYQPDHYVIQSAAKHDTAGFYTRELAYRRDLGYPPFRRLVRLLFVYPQETRARTEAERGAALVRRRIAQLEMTGTEIIGPAPCFFTRTNRDYRWQLLLRGPDPSEALRGLELPDGWHIEVDPLDVL